MEESSSHFADFKLIQGPEASCEPSILLTSPSCDDQYYDEVFFDMSDDGPYASSNTDHDSISRLSGATKEDDQDKNRSRNKASSYDNIPVPETPSVTSLTPETSIISHSPGTSEDKFPFEPDFNRKRTSIDNALKSEKAFIEYVMSLPSAQGSNGEKASPSSQKQRSPTGSQQVAKGATKIGLDHLDNLCKLMEQLSDLRDTNNKLQRRVQYLEDLKSLHEMHKEINIDLPYGSEGALVVSEKRCVHMDIREMHNVEEAEEQCKEQRYPMHKSRTQVNIPQPQGRTRERSKSVGHEEICYPKSKRIFPKWSKVKEALGWDRSTQADNRSSVYQSSSGDRKDTIDPTKMFQGDQMGTLRIPFYPEDQEKDDASPSGSLTEDVRTSPSRYSPGPQSSNEDVRNAGEYIVHHKAGKYKRHHPASMEKRLSFEPLQDQSRRQKLTPSPTKDDQKDLSDIKHKSIILERDIDPEQVFSKFDKEDIKKSKSPWGRVKTIIERRRDSLRRRQRRHEAGNVSPRRDKEKMETGSDISGGLSMEASMGSEDLELELQGLRSDPYFYNLERKMCETSGQDESAAVVPRLQKERSLDLEYWDKQRRHKPPPLSIDTDKFQDSEKIHANHKLKVSISEDCSSMDHRTSLGSPSIECDQQRTPSSSPQFHRKSRWTKVKKVLRGKKEEEDENIGRSHSVPSSPASRNGRLTFNFEDLVLQDGEDNISDDRITDDKTDLKPGEDNTATTTPEEGSNSSFSYHSKLSPSASAPVACLMEELQRNLSEDFSKKYQEWEKIRATGIRPASPKFERKGSGVKQKIKQEKPKSDRLDKAQKHKFKDLNWLDKELQKIEKVTQRLAKEKMKYEERAVRLHKLRETVISTRDSTKKEVLVRTSAGEFRFEGISDAFTKKLYEWETKRGVRPELSTIALLDSSFRHKSQGVPIGVSSTVEKTSPLQRGHSKSESSVVETSQPSHTSSNSLPSLKHESGDIDRSLHSRANSEPDLSTFNSQKEMAKKPRSLSGNMLTVEGDRKSYAPPEVTQLIDSDSEEGFADKDDDDRKATRAVQQAEENYYGLLEENVFLLEQLKTKEEICHRLERDLEELDERMDEMNKHHLQELEKYREKLWEVHKPGNKPRDVQGCLRVVAELKTRIERLENCSERLRNDREALEKSFKFHQEQQSNMTVELLEKMKELHDVSHWGVSSTSSSESGLTKRKVSAGFDPANVAKLHDLSALLLEQTRELEQALAERTRQVCQLRWELLHRDVSTVRLETELQQVHCQGDFKAPPYNRCAAKRDDYAHKRSWSSGEEMVKRRQGTNYNPSLEPLPPSSVEAFTTSKLEYEPNDLKVTVHELNKELLKLSMAADNLFGKEEEEAEKVEAESTKSEIVDHKAASSESNEIQVTVPFEEENYASMATNVECLTVSGNSQIKVRRNSADNISSVSGPEGSESSSLNDVDRSSFVMRLPQRPAMVLRSNSTSSSDSCSLEEESFSSVTWCRPVARGIENINKVFGSPKEKNRSRELILKYPTSRNKQQKDNNKSESKIENGSPQRGCVSDSKIPLSVQRTGSKSDSQEGTACAKEKRKLFAAEKTRFEKSDEFTGLPSQRDHVQRRKRKGGSFEEVKSSQSAKDLEISAINDMKNQDILNGNLSSRQQKISCKHLPKTEPRQLSTCYEPVEEGSPEGTENACRTQESNSQEIPSTFTVVLPRRKVQGSSVKSSKIRKQNSESSCPSISKIEHDRSEDNINANVTVVLRRQRSDPSKSKKYLESKVCANADRSGELTKNDNIHKSNREIMTSVDAAKSSPVIQIRSSNSDTYVLRCNNKSTEIKDVLHNKDNNNKSNVSKSTLKVDDSMCQNLKPESPVIRSRSPRKFKKEPSKDKAGVNKKEKEEKETSGCLKSTSAPQLDWKKMCAKKVLHEGVYNVKTLIEKYNQKVLEHQGLAENRSTASSIPIRKCRTSDDNQSQGYDITGFKLSPCTSFQSCSPAASQMLPSPPMSPASRARAEALQKAKEQFISSNNTVSFKPPQLSDNKNSENANNSPSPVAFQSGSNNHDGDNISTTSGRSMDSVSLVMYRTAEACQESRLARKVEAEKHCLVQKAETEVASCTEDVGVAASKNTSSNGGGSTKSSPFLNLKLRKSKRKKDLATVSELCRQSLFVNFGKDDSQNEPKTSNLSPRSCPSSPELKTKVKSKGGWLPKSFFRQK